MCRNVIAGLLLLATLVVSGCASVPMGSSDEDQALKQFPTPPQGMAGLYVYRDSFMGKALKKSVSLDGQLLGETANGVYFYEVVEPGEHSLSTESEFSDNAIDFMADAGENYFVEQYIKMGIFVGGAGLNMVEKTEGMDAVRKCCHLAASQ
ncbi:DUF2846 domain-containing protein [Chromohalobacter sp. TMW 2.2308]|uniref:DUF2846 domain-containing protein n=1 Tax=Chromohalobacter moromii TaxID=2860329 RepID=A0A9X3AX16_9GAMM|nr:MULTISPECIES: DUF2846 domain-containing protein [Chromohalobacter]CDQ33729.1 hypothetical protein BN993_03176 [Virgibacillus halodenitrificans]MCK2041317.1 DUF2846 domain-containing protein [Chromohalobacter moromii]MCK2044259.1 DUF2846 domain-containing protein [Chromohalobacter moromii]MCT8504581.1 DUF2846 domain-containing protein [Chromohalobacter moromii]MCT8513465.1 DUF2846 domain-containing protein [Chromohalobacter sp. TMW 2.2271]